ncbi:MAG: hypothetical protein KC457_11795 [Myxococcales bacterium]|nr:hypothetical protein [Myxococcales bacterium]
MAEAAPSLEAFLERHPWPATLRDGDPIEGLWSFELPLPVARVWAVLTDTSRTNRALGISPMIFEVRADGEIRGETSNLGFEQRWTEVPWSWVAERTLSSVRLFDRGFAKVSRGIYELAPLGPDRTRVDIYFGWTARSWLGRLVLRLGAGWLAGNYQRFFAALTADLKTTATPVLGPTDLPSLRVPAPALSPEGAARLEACAGKLRAKLGASPAIDRLIEHVRTADDAELERLQVLPLARRWGLETEELLTCCLHATREALLDLSWEVICPHCRGPRTRANTLGDVPITDSCEACDLAFRTDGENALEVVFRVHPAIRDIPVVAYCSAEPARKSHIEIQQRLEPGERRVLATAQSPDAYRIRVRGREDATLLDVADGCEQSSWAWSVDQPLPATLRLGPEPTLELSNGGDAPILVSVERRVWSADALRPGHLFSLQEFRDLFSQEYLDVDIQLAVGEQTIVFSDMVGSTKFYETRGDPEAFVEVKRHFTEVYEEVRVHHGAVVKTIGDAAMGAFSNPLDGLKASAAILRRFGPHRQDTPVRLRMSLHCGSCIAVNLNSGIDYFGSTVNLAAKLQALAEDGQIAMSGRIYQAPGVREYLEAEGAVLTELELEHPAFAKPVAVYRWDVNPPG